jgi:hypothetical protein
VSELMMGLVIIPDDISRLDRISFNTGWPFIYMAEGGYKLTGKRNQSRHQQHKREKDISQEGDGCGCRVAMATYKTSPRS